MPEKIRDPYNYTSYVKLEHLRDWCTTGGRFISASEFARKSGVSSSTIHRLLNGKMASFNTVRTIARALKISPQQLIGGPDE